jgi:hypothetical protein
MSLGRATPHSVSFRGASRSSKSLGSQRIPQRLLLETGTEHMRSLIIALVVASVCDVACAPTPPPTLLASSTPASIMQMLGSADYSLDISSTGSITLTNGEYVEPAAPGSATRLTVRLGDTIATGDLNGDGVEDAAVILVADPGGSGTFSYVAAVVNQDGDLQGVASALLGDRIEIKSMTIRGGTIEVTILDRAPGEPMASPPTIEVTLSYQLHGARLEQGS